MSEVTHRAYFEVLEEFRSLKTLVGQQTELTQSIMQEVSRLQDLVGAFQRGINSLPKKYQKHFFTEELKNLDADHALKEMVEYLVSFNKTVLRPTSLQDLACRYARRLVKHSSFRAVIDELMSKGVIEAWTAKSGKRWIWATEGLDYAIASPKFRSTELMKELNILPTEAQMPKIEKVNLAAYTAEIPQKPRDLFAELDALRPTSTKSEPEQDSNS